jgi:hypothetical protein
MVPDALFMLPMRDCRAVKGTFQIVCRSETRIGIDAAWQPGRDFLQKP